MTDFKFMTCQDMTLTAVAELIRAALMGGRAGAECAEALAADLALDDDYSADAIAAALAGRLGIEAMRGFTEAWASEIADLPADFDFQFSATQARAAAGLYRAVGDETTADDILAALDARDPHAASTEQDVPPEHQADPDEDARIAQLVRRWAQTIAAALDSAGKALAIIRDLERCDGELFESSAATNATAALNEAWERLYAAGGIARSRLKLVEEAERDAELERLRAEVGQLQRRLADHACDVCGDGPGDVAASASARAILAEDATRYHGFVAALDGTLRFCALAPGHDDWCVDSDGHVIVTAAGPAAAPDPIEGEGSDLD